MSALAFFPWLKIEKEVSLPGVSLIPFTRDENVSDPALLSANKILEHYRERDYNQDPVRYATLIRLDGKNLLENYTEELVKDLFAIVEIIAFSGLATREFFRDMNYCNRIDFMVTIDPDTDGGYGLSTRRRDGVGWHGVSASIFKETRPRHCNRNSKVAVDEPLAKALLTAKSGLLEECWARYRDAIVKFNWANTDIPEFQPQEEVVMLLGAIQRILDVRCNTSKTVAAFSEAFLPNCAAKSKNKSGAAWLNSFCLLRNDFGHGKTSNRSQQSGWDTRTHLLLATYVVPLLVKLQLKKSGFYQLSDQDNSNIEMFEDLVKCKPFDYDPNDERNDESPWAKIRSDRKLQALVKLLDSQVPDIIGTLPDGGRL